MTNREVLARKSNEELAGKIVTMFSHQICDCCIGQYYGSDICKEQCDDCKHGIQQWLEQEAKDDE